MHNLQWEIYHNKAHNLWPRARVFWGYNEILCNKKSLMNIYKFIIMSFNISVAANTFDLPTLGPIHFCMKRVFPCWDDPHHQWGGARGKNLPLPVNATESPSQMFLPLILWPKKIQTSVGYLTNHAGDTVCVHRVTGPGNGRIRAGKHMTEWMWDDTRSSRFHEEKRIFCYIYEMSKKDMEESYRM